MSGLGMYRTVMINGIRVDVVYNRAGEDSHEY